ncbi:ABC transporter substrate-binding protein [Albimonas sp. CAU 1670]|uniref:ABC transporter substrate-binding protein n=1 Tax=Albimonas sp. CAU 1670 TaxID=3032599 RepID=UPI0023DAFDEA|nr:ABC transporter substrate-binding protein [Albimonas sp. CAU 1670]MDF2233858.1 ABC transporter substrate-binding protein [Albimonas sp. CAU 1670]
MKRAFLAAVAAAALSLPTLSLAAEKLVFAWTPNPQTPQVDVALAKDYFAEAGLEVEIVSFPSGREGFEALIGGQVDVAFMAEFPAAVGVLRGQDFKVVGDLARFRGSRVIGNTKAGPLASPADLAGRNIGTVLGTNVDFYLSKVLEQAGVSATVINAGPADLAPAVARRDVDAMVTFPTFYAAAKAALGDDYVELKAPGYSVHFILSANGESLRAKPEAFEAFMAALAKADADVAADPSAAQDAVLANMKGAMPKPALEAMWSEVEIGLTLDRELLDLIVEEAAWIVGKGIVKADAPSTEAVRDAFDPAPLSAAKPEAVALD